MKGFAMLAIGTGFGCVVLLTMLRIYRGRK